MKNLNLTQNPTLSPQETQFKGAILAGTIALSWMGSILPQDTIEPAQAAPYSEYAFRCMRTAPQIMEKPVDGDPFRPLNGSFTHIVYDPMSSEPFFDEADLSLREVEDSDKVNEILAQLCENYHGSHKEQIIPLILYLLAPRYERFLRRALPEAGYMLVHQPSVVNRTLFPIEVDTFTFAQSMRTDIADMMHTISVGYSCITEDDLETIIVMLAHEMAHRLREHALEETYYRPLTQEGFNDLIRDQEREADRIALLMLRDERYIKAQIKKFAQEMDYPYVLDKTTGRKRKMVTDGSTTHPPHQERIYSALVFWVELIMKRDNLSEETAWSLVREKYQALLEGLNLQESTVQQLSQLI